MQLLAKILTICFVLFLVISARLTPVADKTLTADHHLFSGFLQTALAHDKDKDCGKDKDGGEEDKDDDDNSDSYWHNNRPKIKQF